jgi:hypothetical protein
MLLISINTQAQFFVEPSFGTTYKPTLGYHFNTERNFQPEVFASYDLSYSSTTKKNMASGNIGLLSFQNMNPILQVTPHVGLGYYTVQVQDHYDKEGNYVQQYDAGHGWQLVYGMQVGVDIKAAFNSRLAVIASNADRFRINFAWRIYIE